MTSKVSLGQWQSHQRSLNTEVPTPKGPLHKGSSHQPAPPPPINQENDEPYGALHRDLCGPSFINSQMDSPSSDSRWDSATQSAGKPMADEISLSRLSLPRRGRPWMHSALPILDGWNTQDAQPCPFPVRPEQHPTPLAQMDGPGAAAAACLLSVKKDTRPKPYISELPKTAPHFPPTGHADYSPWIGSHAEDQYSESAIRHGFCDKIIVSQNETGAARSSIFPAVKHKSGLQTLSSLLTNILSQRQLRGQITAASSFKPPPRVTVTDTKREMWLKDLATPSIPLRRLSRSIPHGIRGKILLEQSLSKQIPCERAVWLAKCVGANELRSFRRKGINGNISLGGETKWIRDFTISVEQFVESVVSSCGEARFRMRLDYALRLAAHLYAEQLLEREHYMDWLISALETASPLKLPIWLLITHMYWKELLTFRKSGRRLATTLLQHLSENLKLPDRDLLSPLIEKITRSLQELILCNSATLVSPKTWRQYRDVIYQHVVPMHNDLVSAVDEIEHRNARLGRIKTKKSLSIRQMLIKCLDSSLEQPCKTDIAGICWRLGSHQSDMKMLVDTLLDWASSAYRPGLAKVYVGARIMRVWSSLGLDTTDSVLSFLCTGGCEIGRDRCAFYLLVSQLTRSGHFCAPRYLRWLVARGGLHESMQVMADSPCSTRLLVELPMDALSEDMTALRSSILNRAQFSGAAQDSNISTSIALIDQALSSLGSTGSPQTHLARPSDTGCDDAELQALSRYAKTTIGVWLRDRVQASVIRQRTASSDHWETTHKPYMPLVMTKDGFQRSRRYIELIDDYAMLGDVLEIAAMTVDGDILAMCADTLHLHLLIFAGIGVLDLLLQRLLDRWKSLSMNMEFVPKRFLVSLVALCQAIPGKGSLSRELEQEIERCDRQTTVDACSPISYHIAHNASDVEFADEIEKALGAGTTMDQATMASLFKRLVETFTTLNRKSTGQQMNCIALLSRLRSFDHDHFDKLMIAWIHHDLLQDRPAPLVELLTPLLASACISFKDIFKAFFDYHASVSMDSPSLGHNIRQIMSLVLTTPRSAQDMDMNYRLRVKQIHSLSHHPTEVLSLFRLHCKEAGFSSENLNSASACMELINSYGQMQVACALQTLALSDADLVCQHLVMPVFTYGSPCQQAELEILIDLILFPDCPRKSRLLSSSITTVVGVANDLTVPYCHLKLCSMFDCGPYEQVGSEEQEEHKFQALDEGVDTAVSTQVTSWLCIIPLLGSSITEHLSQRAERQFLELFSNTDQSCVHQVSIVESDISKARTLLQIIEVTAQESKTSLFKPVNAVAATIPTIQKLHQALSLFSRWQSDGAEATSVKQGLLLLLDFLAIQIFVPPLTKATEEHRGRISLFLTDICLNLWASNNDLKVMDDVLEQTFDLALNIVDTLSDELRQSYTRRIRLKSSDPRIQHLYNYAADSSDWLVVSQKDGAVTQHDAASDSKVNGGSENRSGVRFSLRRWELLGEPTPNIGDNDTSLSLTLFGARREPC